tara:strand:+ start:16642 stop:18945 length:2304 start_codon:yes stop_codon:yes gene_type:complete
MFRRGDETEYINSIRQILTKFIECYEKYHTIVYEIHRRRTGWGYNLRLQTLEENEGDIIMSTNDLLIKRPWRVLEHTLSQNNSFISSNDLLQHIDQNYAQVTTTHTQLEFKTTRDYKFARYLNDNLETIIEKFFTICKMYLGNLKILPEQVLVVIWNTTILPFHSEACIIPHETYTDIDRIMIVRNPANVPLKFHINTSMPGSGKSIILGQTAMRLVNDDNVFNLYYNAHQNPPDHVDYGGFSANLRTEQKYLARVFLIICPVPLKAQLHETMKKIVAGTAVELWFNLDSRTMKTAYESKKRIIWIVPMNQTTTAMLRDEPLYDFLGCGMDECNASMTKHGNFPESEAMTYIITQATPNKLNDDMSSKPRHKLRQSLQYPAFPMINSALTKTSANAFLKAQMMFTPEFIRDALNSRAITMMPIGYYNYTLTCNFVNMRTALTGQRNDILAPIGIREFLKAELAPHASRVANISPDQYEQLIERLNVEQLGVDVISGILTDAVQMIVLPTNAHMSQQRAAATMRSNLMRLSANLDSMFQSETECPVMLCPITRTNATILSCCMNIISQEADDNLRKRHTVACPLCRVGRQTSVVMTMDNEQVNVSNFELIDDESIADTIQRLTDLKNNPIDSIANLIIASIHTNPSSRIILMSARFLGSDVANLSGISYIHNKVHTMFPRTNFVDSSGRKKVNISKYNNPLQYPEPYVVLMDISDNSNTAQGLDLYATTLSIMAGDARTDIKLQLIMRSSRMGLNNANSPARVIVSIV